MNLSPLHAFLLGSCWALLIMHVWFGVGCR